MTAGIIYSNSLNGRGFGKYYGITPQTSQKMLPVMVYDTLGK
jgi:hypothetical protein